MIKWDDTVVSKCRYGDVAGRIFSEAEVIWEHSELSYQLSCQGSANVLVRMPDGKFGHYEWTYGSCYGCDEWARLSDDDEKIDDLVEIIMRNEIVWFEDIITLQKYLKLDDPERMMPVNTDYYDNNDFYNMGEAFKEWYSKVRKD